MTWIVICAVLIFGVIAYRRHMRAPSASGRRKTYAWAWAFWGAIAGSFFGIAGFGTAVSGAGLGAVVGYLAATALIRVDPPDSGNNAAPPKRAVVEPGTFAITQDRTLREAIGIETLGESSRQFWSKAPKFPALYLKHLALPRMVKRR